MKEIIERVLGRGPTADALLAELQANAGDISDGHHTFKELYEHRHALFAAVCFTNGHSWKSKLHSDGTMFDGWFIAGILLKTGMISYHLPLEWWDRVHGAEFLKAPEWDGHTPADVVERIVGCLGATDRA